MQGSESQHVLFVDVAPFTGGAQRSLESLVEELVDSHWVPKVLSADRSPDGLVERCRARGIEVRALHTAHWRKSLLGGARFLCDRFTAGRRVAQAVTDWEPTVIHANGVRAALVIPADIWQRRGVCVHDRDLNVPDLVVRMISRRAAGVIAISHCVAEKWNRQQGDRRLWVVPNGLDLEAVRREAARPLHDDLPASPIVVLVADMVPWKQHDLFLEAMDHVRQRVDSVSALIVGRTRTRSGARYRRALQVYARQLDLADVVHFVTDASSAIPWLAKADVVVSAAAREPFGRTVVEALALGKPVVAVRGSGPEEILEGCQAGTLTGNSAAELAAGICYWLEKQQSADTARQARQRAEAFNVNRMTTTIQHIYQELAAGKRQNS